VTVTRDKITWPGARIRKKGEGMPNYENNNLFGTLYVTFDVAFPKGELSQEDKEGIRKLLKQVSMLLNLFLFSADPTFKSTWLVDMTGLFSLENVPSCSILW